MKPIFRIWALDLWVQNGRKKHLGFRPRDPHGKIGAGILCWVPVPLSQIVGWRAIWVQKYVIWGPLGFWAKPAHPRRAD